MCGNTTGKGKKAYIVLRMGTSLDRFSEYCFGVRRPIDRFFGEFPSQVVSGTVNVWTCKCVGGPFYVVHSTHLRSIARIIILSFPPFFHPRCWLSVLIRTLEKKRGGGGRAMPHARRGGGRERNLQGMKINKCITICA